MGLFPSNLSKRDATSGTAHLEQVIFGKRVTHTTRRRVDLHVSSARPQPAGRESNEFDPRPSTTDICSHKKHHHRCETPSSAKSRPHVTDPSPDTNSDLIDREAQSVHTGDTFHSCFGDDVHQHSSVTDDPLRVFDSNLHVHPNAGRLGIRIVDDVRVPPHRRQVTETAVSFAG